MKAVRTKGFNEEQKPINNTNEMHILNDEIRKKIEQKEQEKEKQEEYLIFYKNTNNLIKSLPKYKDPYIQEKFQIKLKNKVIEYLKELNNNRVILNEKYRQLYSILFAYFTGDIELCKKYNLNLNKGIYLYGSVGTGKTTIMKAFQRLTTFININKFVFYKASNIIANAYREGFEEIYSVAYGMGAKPQNIYIDDIGLENEVVNYYGTKIKVIENLILLRYDYMKTYGVLTHVSSNLHPSKLNYDTKVLDRIKEIFNFIEFNGESLRS